MAGNLIKGLIQVCIVTSSFEETVRTLADRFGIGPWKCWHYTPPTIFDTRREGKPSAWTMKLGVAWVGDVQLEVIQPTSGTTIYAEHIERQGEGVQHLLVKTGPGYFDAIRAFEQAGYATTQSARINPPLQAGPLTLPPLPGFLAQNFATQFVYHDTRVGLGVILETSKMPPGISFRLGVRLGKPDFKIAGQAGSTPIRAIDSVGILTEDLDTTLLRWSDLGVGPWEDIPAEGAAIRAAPFGPATLELIQPAGTGLYRDLLEASGPGVGYLGVRGAQADAFRDAGCAVLGETAQGVYLDARATAHTVFRV